MVDYGSYFVTIYRKNETIWRLEKEKERKKKENIVVNYEISL